MGEKILSDPQKKRSDLQHKCVKAWRIHNLIPLGITSKFKVFQQITKFPWAHYYLFIERDIGDWYALTVGSAWFRALIFEHGVHSPCTLMSHGHNQVDELFILLIYKNLYRRMMQTSSTQEEKVSFSEALKWLLTADFLSKASYQVVV